MHPLIFFSNYTCWDPGSKATHHFERLSRKREIPKGGSSSWAPRSQQLYYEMVLTAFVKYTRLTKRYPPFKTSVSKALLPHSEGTKGAIVSCCRFLSMEP